MAKEKTTKTVCISITKEQHKLIQERCISPSKLMREAINRITPNKDENK